MRASGVGNANLDFGLADTDVLEVFRCVSQNGLHQPPRTCIYSSFIASSLKCGKHNETDHAVAGSGFARVPVLNVGCFKCADARFGKRPESPWRLCITVAVAKVQGGCNQ
jgi:hypothetical protein